jgi:hypothetical protein
MKTKTLLWWFPAAIVAIVAVVEGGMHMGARAAKKHGATSAATASCRTGELAVDLDGDGRTEMVKLVRVGNEAWADVWSDSALKSSTKLGGWREDAVVEALDVNGDGKIDLVRRWSQGPEQHAQVWLSDGAAFDEGWSGVTANTCLAQR